MKVLRNWRDWAGDVVFVLTLFVLVFLFGRHVAYVLVEVSEFLASIL